LPGTGGFQIPSVKLELPDLPPPPTGTGIIPSDGPVPIPPPPPFKQ
jgi:hypothetical protein